MIIFKMWFNILRISELHKENATKKSALPKQQIDKQQYHRHKSWSLFEITLLVIMAVLFSKWLSTED